MHRLPHTHFFFSWIENKILSIIATLQQFHTHHFYFYITSSPCSMLKGRIIYNKSNAALLDHFFKWKKWDGNKFTGFEDSSKLEFQIYSIHKNIELTLFKKICLFLFLIFYFEFSETNNYLCHASLAYNHASHRNITWTTYGGYTSTSIFLYSL